MVNEEELAGRAEVGRSGSADYSAAESARAASLARSSQVSALLNTVRLHLRALAEAGLVSARREERTQPGRPRVLYEAVAEPPDEPARASYRLLAQILASYLAGSERDPSARAEEAGRAWGAHLVPKPAPFTSISKQETLDEVVRLHEQYGFKAELRQANSGQAIVLKRCPFQEVATTYQTVVRPVHLGLTGERSRSSGLASKRIGSSRSPSQALASAT